MKSVKSIKFNMVMNIIRVVFGKIFPLISFPYITRVLLPEGVGKSSFVFSFTYYFQVIAALGISTYAIREGARIRDNKKKIETFLNDMLLLNLFSTLAAYVLLIICVIIMPLNGYRTYIIFYSMTILLSTIGVEYVFSIFEEYVYITVRSLLIQFLSLISLFVFVRDKNDVLVYIILTACASGLSNLYNLTYSKKFVKLFHFRSIKNLKKYLKPVITIFAAGVSSTLYNNIDVLMLSFIHGDASTGLYSAATKLNTSIGGLVTAVSGVILPRISYLLERKETEQLNTIIIKVMKYYLFAVIAIAVGLIPLSYEIIDLFCGTQFHSAGLTMKIMLCVLIFCMVNNFLANQVFVAYKLESQVFRILMFGAVENIILNIILIPMWAENAAALTTLLTEMSVFILLVYQSGKIIDLKEVFSESGQLVLASFMFVLVYLLTSQFCDSDILQIVIVIFIGGGCYCGSLLLMKNSTMLWFIGEGKKLIKKYIAR